MTEGERGVAFADIEANLQRAEEEGRPGRFKSRP